MVGRLHHLTVEAIDAGQKELYEAKVWVKPWSNFKELQEYKHADDAHASPSSTTSDLVVNKGSSLLKLSSNSYCRKLLAFQKRKIKSLYLTENAHARGDTI